MARAIRAIGPEDRLSIVDHLDELRTRLMISAAVLAVAFGICLWQNHTLLKILNEPLTSQTQKKIEKGEGTEGQAAVTQKGVIGIAARTEEALAVLVLPSSHLPAATRTQLLHSLAAIRREARKVPSSSTPLGPAVLGVGEAFTTTITVSLYCALILALPVILYELYGFILPALKPEERRIARPILTGVPFLFVAGVLFGYFVVLHAAIRFFVNFNSTEFNVLVQANQLYNFEATVILAMGVVFQVPVVILGATELGLVTPTQLRHNRRYAIVACAAIAAFLPGDAITLILETVPLYVLYEASILLASFAGRRSAARREAATPDSEGGARHEGASAQPSTDPEPTVQQIIDHVDPSLSD